MPAPRVSAPRALALGVWLLSAPVTAAAQDADPWFGRDKALHFGVEVGISAASYGAAVPLWDEPWQRALFAAGVGLSVGAGKELYDATGQGDPSLRDFTWDVLGCAVGVGVSWLVDVALRGPGEAPSRSAAARGAAPVLLRF